MFDDATAFSSFAVPDVEAARAFYGDTLGLDVRDSRERGLLELHLGGAAPVLVYPKPDHAPANFTVLNFAVSDIDAAVDGLIGAGIRMERTRTSSRTRRASCAAPRDRRSPGSRTRRATSCRSSKTRADVMRFHTTVLQGGKTATGIEIPEEIVTALGSGKRPKVLVTINGYMYRSTVAPLGGVYMVGVSSDVRQAAGVAGGDAVDVDIELDTAPREVTVPDDFAAAPDAAPAARTTFESLSYSNKSWHVLQIEGAKSDETRQRRIARSVEALGAGRIP